MKAKYFFCDWPHQMTTRDQTCSCRAWPTNLPLNLERLFYRPAIVPFRPNLLTDPLLLLKAGPSLPTRHVHLLQFSCQAIKTTCLCSCEADLLCFARIRLDLPTCSFHTHLILICPNDLNLSWHDEHTDLLLLLMGWTYWPAPMYLCQDCLTTCCCLKYAWPSDLLLL